MPELHLRNHLLIWEGITGNPFKVFSEVKDLYKEILKNKAKTVADWKKRKADWTSANPDLDRKLKDFYKGNIPSVDYSAIIQKEGVATRAASSTVLGTYADIVENMIVASADLANSDKTDGFLKKDTSISER